MKAILPKLTMIEKIIQKVLPKYTNKIYNLGVKRGYNWYYEGREKHIKEYKKEYR